MVQSYLQAQEMKIQDLIAHFEQFDLDLHCIFFLVAVQGLILTLLEHIRGETLLHKNSVNSNVLFCFSVVSIGTSNQKHVKRRTK